MKYKNNKFLKSQIKIINSKAMLKNVKKLYVYSTSFINTNHKPNNSIHSIINQEFLKDLNQILIISLKSQIKTLKDHSNQIKEL